MLATRKPMRTVARMARPRSARVKEATNLSLSSEVKKQAIKVADERYGISLTELVERLLEKEITLKRGGAHVTVRIGEANA